MTYSPRSCATARSAAPSSCAGMSMGFLTAAGTSSAREMLRIEKQTTVAIMLAFKNTPPQLELCTVSSACDGLLQDKSACDSEILTPRFSDADRGVRLDNAHAETLAQEFGHGSCSGYREDATDPELPQLGVVDDQLLGILPIERSRDLTQRLGVENEQAGGPGSNIRGMGFAMFAGLRRCHDRLLARGHQHGAGGTARWGRLWGGTGHRHTAVQYRNHRPTTLSIDIELCPDRRHFRVATLNDKGPHGIFGHTEQ